MKKTKVIIPALGLLLLSTAASVTGTVAWFAANSQVTASGMKVQAKSDSEFLQILDRDGTWNDNDPFTSITINNTSVKEVKPTHVAKAIADGGATFTEYDGAATGFKWISTSSDNVANKTKGSTAVYEDVSATATTDYTLLNQLKIRVKPGTASTAINFRVASVAFTATEQTPTDVTDGLINSLRVLVVGADYGVIWKNGAFVMGATNSIVDASVDTSGANLDVYVYFDGEDESCFTNNALTPDEYSVTIGFTCGNL